MSRPSEQSSIKSTWHADVNPGASPPKRSVAETVLPANWDVVIVETLKNRFGNTHQLHPEKLGASANS
jgi:hypothetical protein